MKTQPYKYNTNHYDNKANDENDEMRQLDFRLLGNF